MKRIKFVIALLVSVLIAISCASSKETPVEEETPKYTLREPVGEPVVFSECWGYVNQGKEDEYSPDFPVTDVCYFAADFNCYGELIDIPKRSKLELAEDTRCHFVVICDSKSLTHFVLSPEYPVRNSVIKSIVSACKDFDGLQLDFELIPARDGQIYFDFIKTLHSELNKAYPDNPKMFSVCVPARFRLLSEDLFPYAKLAAECDRIFVMAYDEHWSTSKPGAIASVEWCKKVLEYAQGSVPPEKLIMGAPFYGRTWVDKSHSGGWYYSSLNRVMDENKVQEVIYEDDIPTFTYEAKVTVTGYFNDAYSLVQLCRLYEEAGCRNIGFWRIGQETPDFWDWLEIE